MERVVEREQRRLVAAVFVACAGEPGGDLVRRLTRGPERTGAVEELLQLGAYAPEARGTAEGHSIRPAQVIDRGDLDVGVSSR